MNVFKYFKSSWQQLISNQENPTLRNYECDRYSVFYQKTNHRLRDSFHSIQFPVLSAQLRQMELDWVSLSLPT